MNIGNVTDVSKKCEVRVLAFLACPTTKLLVNIQDIHVAVSFGLATSAQVVCTVDPHLFSPQLSGP